MPYHGLSTVKIARSVGCHPNTVRLYEQWGYIPAARRSPAGYRLFEPFHLDQMRLARLLLQWPYPGGKAPVERLVRSAAARDLSTAHREARLYLECIRQEIEQALAAIEALGRMARGAPPEPLPEALRMGQACALLNLTRDAMRSWERNNLLRVPRDPRNGNRRFGAGEVARLRVIRLLRGAGFGMMAVLRAMTGLDEGRFDAARDALQSPGPDPDILHAADHWLEVLREREAAALSALALLEEMQLRYPAV